MPCPHCGAEGPQAARFCDRWAARRRAKSPTPIRRRRTLAGRLVLVVLLCGAAGVGLASPVAAGVGQSAERSADQAQVQAMPPAGSGRGVIAQTTGAISGVVTTAGGVAVPGIHVTASAYAAAIRCEPGSGEGSQTDSQGRYRIDVAPGDYLVYVNSHDYTPAILVPEAYPDVNSWSRISEADPVTVTAGGVVSDVDFSLPAGFAVTGRLVDELGRPMGGAGGNLLDPDQDIEYGCHLGFGTGGDGRFRVHVPAGLYDLAFGSGSEGHVVRRSLTVNQHSDLGDVLFAEAPSVRVFDPYPVLPGYAVETVVPGGPNTPSDVAVTADGVMYLAAIRSWQVYRVGSDGAMSGVASIGVYALDAGPDGNLYGYFMPSDADNVYRITPSGQVSVIGTMPETACESTLTVAPNLDLWIGYNFCGGTGFGDSRLYRMTPSGEVSAVVTGLPCCINGLDFDSSGRLYMTWGSGLYRVQTSNGSRAAIATLPPGAGGASHGLVAAPDGSFYISVQGDGGEDCILKVSAAGAATRYATLPDGCLQGLERLPNGDLIATMRCTNALYRVTTSGMVQTLRAGNGMATPQAMAFNLAGELLVNNDESGRIVRIVNGRGQFFAAVLSYISPMGSLAFEPSGSFYFSEAAPGFRPRLIRVSPQGAITETTGELDWPSGLAFTPAGTLHASEYMSGEVSAVTSAGAVSSFAAGLIRPQAMAADRSGNLYVAAYEGPPPFPYHPGTNRLWKIDPEGSRTLYATLPDSHLRDLALSPAGELYVTGPAGRQSGVSQVTTDGRTVTFARGFLDAVGLAFDLKGDLYVSDDEDNSITRIRGFPQGAIAGQVTDARTALPIPSASLAVVTDFPVVLGAQLQADSDGRYSLAAAPRAYSVSASAPGHASASHPITVTAGLTGTLDFRLAPWPASRYLPLILE
jgi:sugar lactone lactonase YvrE